MVGEPVSRSEVVDAHHVIGAAFGEADDVAVEQDDRNAVGGERTDDLLVDRLAAGDEFERFEENACDLLPGILCAKLQRPVGTGLQIGGGRVAPQEGVAGLLAAAGEATVFDDLGCGDWRTIVRLSLAAVICGCFWEMWNMHSLARWVYDVPYVGRFKIFEMPLLGYAGYGPFGWECAAVAMVFGLWQPAPDHHQEHAS